MELTADKTFGTCEYCGSTMTLPKVDDEQRAAAFNRGNHFRRIGEFDKALMVYERIVREDDSDAEAHWCCALCRFGIEYVEDPNTYEYLPTCHRASFDSFLEDVDYLAAVEHSDGLTKRQYQRDAVKIAEVQRGILATSQTEEPYDVFICYKETDETGARTRDSVMAQEIYYQLTENGSRVFFARISLETIAGKQYEPYIFAALNSAKVMIVVGTKSEHLNAVWVKNEWSRFLAMMRKDRSKLLIPCYRDMDPYDMPEQLSVLQSYDMSKLGFMQDLSRGVLKILNQEEKNTNFRENREQPVVQQLGSNMSALLKRGYMALEDGEWEKADGFFEDVLNQNAECAEAYLGKVLAEKECSTMDQLIQKELDATCDAWGCQHTLEGYQERIDLTVEKYSIPRYYFAEDIRREYMGLNPVYESFVESRCEQKDNVEYWWNNNRNLTRALQFADQATAQQIQNAKTKMFGVMDERIAVAREDMNRVKTEQEIICNQFVDAADAVVVDNYNKASERRHENYLRLCELQEQANDKKDFEKLIIGYNEMQDYLDCKDHIQQCYQMIQNMEENIRKHREQVQEIERQKYWMRTGRCQHCGGILKGVLNKRCVSCGRPKDY